MKLIIKPKNSRTLQKDAPYTPISSFGIGLLSAFLIADKLIIETKNTNQESCLFTIDSTAKEWRYEQGNMVESGTKITLFLNDEGQQIKLEEVLYHYFLVVDVPLFYAISGKKFKKFINSWNAHTIANRYTEKWFNSSEIFVEEIINLSSDEYDVILLNGKISSYEKIIIFNQGIFIDKMDSTYLNYGYALYVNFKDDIVNLNISRESVIKDEKFFQVFKENL